MDPKIIQKCSDNLRSSLCWWPFSEHFLWCDLNRISLHDMKRLDFWDLWSEFCKITASFYGFSLNRCCREKEQFKFGGVYSVEVPSFYMYLGFSCRIHFAIVLSLKLRDAWVKSLNKKCSILVNNFKTRVGNWIFQNFKKRKVDLSDDPLF